MSVLPGPLAGLLGRLGREEVQWCLLRPRASLSAPRGDIDLLVRPADLGRVAALLADCGFLDMPVPGPDVHAALYDPDTGRFVWIHVQVVLRLAGAEIAAEEVLADASGGEVPQPAESWLLWILLLRALVDKGELAERHREETMALAGRWDGGPARLVSLAREHRIDPESAVGAAAAGDWEGLMAHSVHGDDRAPGLPSRLARVSMRLLALRNLRHRRGLSVAVIGPDGAGKTTLIEGLESGLPLPTRVQYMGLTGGQMPKAERLRVPGVVLAARIAILWLRWARSAIHRGRGGIVLFDRYTLDGAVPSGIALNVLGRVSRRVQRRAVPMPDLVLLLDAPGSVMHERKGEYEPEVLETWRGAYGRLQGRVPALEVLDARQPVDAVRRQAEALIWARFAELRRRGRASA